MLSVLHKTIKYRLVLPLIIRATKNKTILHPDATTGKMKACINKRLSEIKSLCISMEHIC